MSTNDIIQSVLTGNLSDAKNKTESLLYSKAAEILNESKEHVIGVVYEDSVGVASLVEKKKAKKKKDDDDNGKKYAKKTDKEDVGEGLDPVDAEDSDVDNDGDSDESDDYLKNRRKVRKKEIEDDEEEEVKEDYNDEDWAKKYKGNERARKAKVEKVKKDHGKAFPELLKKDDVKESKEGVKDTIKGLAHILQGFDPPDSGGEVTKERYKEAMAKKKKKKEVKEGKEGDGRASHIYGMEIKKYRNLTDKQKHQLKMKWHHKKSHDEKAKGHNE